MARIVGPAGLDGADSEGYTWTDLDERPAMTASRDATTQAALDRVLNENGLSLDTRLYREAVRETLAPTGDPTVYRLAANPSPSEAVVDVYGQGYLVQAEQVGAGLAFAETPSPNWQETMEMRALRAGRGPLPLPPPDRVEVAIRLEDVFRQGGLIYPVESVTVERAWYCTLPSGWVDVREVG